MSRMQIVGGALGVAAAGLVLGLLATSWTGSPRTAHAADHSDAPLLTGRPLADLNDIYAFDGADPDDIVLVMTVNPSVVATTSTPLFANDVLYQVFIDNSPVLDNVADEVVTVRFSGSNPQIFTVSGASATPIMGEVTAVGDPPNLVSEGDITVFCGLRDDPFFFDLTGFRSFVTNLYVPDQGLRVSTGPNANAPPADSFAGKNISAIVIELPKALISPTGSANSGTLRLWSKTFEVD